MDKCAKHRKANISFFLKNNIKSKLKIHYIMKVGIHPQHGDVRCHRGGAMNTTSCDVR